MITPAVFRRKRAPTKISGFRIRVLSWQSNSKLKLHFIQSRETTPKRPSQKIFAELPGPGGEGGIKNAE
jgi:hypothetical protein